MGGSQLIHSCSCSATRYLQRIPFRLGWRRYFTKHLEARWFYSLSQYRPMCIKKSLKWQMSLHQQLIVLQTLWSHFALCSGCCCNHNNTIAKHLWEHKVTKSKHQAARSTLIICSSETIQNRTNFLTTFFIYKWIQNHEKNIVYYCQFLQCSLSQTTGHAYNLIMSFHAFYVFYAFYVYLKLMVNLTVR